KDKYEKILNEYKLKPEEISAIGDQLLTDIYGANRMGIRSILVNPISNVDFFATHFNRFFENIIMKILNKKELFTRGKYFE
ncbi:YqeG family HAD IIIA-type phosphatase, partial [bacterium]|nr:YqeG family HAD IIIA-type phosphatase [bacterium]